MMFMKTKKVFSLLFYCIIAAVSFFVLMSCGIIDNYFVKKVDYDLLDSKYRQLSGDLEKEETDVEKKTAENDILNNNIQEKDKKIQSYEEEIAALKEELSSKSIKNLEDRIEELQKEPQKLRILLNNIDNLLKNVYIGSSAGDGGQYTFTAFGIEYKGKYYIVTAGHCVNDNYSAANGTFKFKANFSQTWIQPELIAYKAEFWNLDDYAIFYSDKIPGGMRTGDLKTEESYLLGSIDKGLSIFRNHGGSSKKGESGSPVINENMEVVGIYVIYGEAFTPIQLALDAIDSAAAN
jgi:hypothetical protein